jgi:hypothetical protein
MALRLTLPLFVASLFLAGCASPAASDLVEAEETGSRVEIVDEETGTTITVTVNDTTGAVVGHVLTDAGFGLPGALVVVTGADSSTTTNDTGWFEVPRVPPGKRIVRAEHSSYRSAESEIDVAAGAVRRLTITLIPTEADAGLRPHTHDYWAGREQVQVIDADFPWQRATRGGPYGSAQDQILTPLSMAVHGDCVFGQRQNEVSTLASRFFFPEEEQLVWPGTARMEIKLSWPSGTYAGGEMMALVWKSGSDTSYNWSKALRQNDLLSIDVEMGKQDSGHQPFSLWEFYVCLWGKNEPPVYSTAHVGRTFRGNFHVQMTLVKGTSLETDPPHPRFWAEGDTLTILDGYRNVTCQNLSFCTTPPIYGRSASMAWFRWLPNVGSLVPPSAGSLTATLTWQSSLPTKPLSLTFSPANLPPRTKDDPGTYLSGKLVSATSSKREYSFDVAPGQNDGFYQTNSNWAFLWSPEGSERDSAYLHDCGCDLVIRLVVKVHRTVE